MPHACACQRAEHEALRARAISAEPAARGQLAVDRAALRRALGGRAEVIEAMNAKASGRPGVNAARMWAFMTTSVYQSGDLPVLATREALQNGIDAIKAAIRARKTRAGEGRFEVTWDPERLMSPTPRGIRYSSSGTSPFIPYIISLSRKITGLLSRMAAFKRPLPSYGVEGETTLSPGTLVNIAS